jgi:outer membrane receptor protein involved in Fe transport
MVNAHYSFDASLGRAIRKGALKGLAVRVGCNNIFNRMPPLARDTWTDANADIGTYGYLGRVIYIDASYKF